MIGKHSHGDSRLTCVDCGEIICTKCLVQCPVGFRCQNCSGRFKSHLIIVSPWIIARTVLTCIALGSIYGFVMRDGGFSIFSFVIPYFVGAFCGKVVHKIAAYKLGKKVVASIVSGLVIGLLLSPISGNLYGAIFAMIATPSNAVGAMTSIIYSAGPAAIFVFGVLSPIIYGYTRRS